MKLKQIENLSAQFNANQRWAFDAITFAIEIDSEIAHFFRQSSIEMNKTFLYKVFCFYYRERDHIILCVTFFNIATLLLLDEITSHSRFKTSLKIDDHFKCAFVFQSDTAQLLWKTFLIIWDEIRCSIVTALKRLITSFEKFMNAISVSTNVLRYLMKILHKYCQLFYVWNESQRLSSICKSRIFESALIRCSDDRIWEWLTNRITIVMQYDWVVCCTIHSFTIKLSFHLMFRENSNWKISNQSYILIIFCVMSRQIRIFIAMLRFCLSLMIELRISTIACLSVLRVRAENICLLMRWFLKKTKTIQHRMCLLRFCKRWIFSICRSQSFVWSLTCLLLCFAICFLRKKCVTRLVWWCNLLIVISYRQRS